MKTSIKQFLADLYEIDPSLKSRQTELIPLLEKLLAQDPSHAPDAAFVARLRLQLNERVGAMQPQPAGSFWQKFAYAFGGAVTAAVIIPVAIIATNQHPISSNTPLFSNSVQATGQNAFGSLNGIAGVSLEAISARPMGGGGMPPVATQSAVRVEAPIAYGDADAKMIAPWPMVQYQYVFSGALTGLQPTVDVYKRDSKPLKLSMSVIADRLNLGGLNMGSFNGMNIDNIAFTQQTPFGYQMYVNLRDASVNIDANWEQWPQSKCQTDACWQAERVKIGELLADAELLSIAKTFASEHGIDLSIYGQPEVDNSWKREYERSTDKTNAYIPDIQRVVYPQLIDGQVVHDQSGIPAGLSISVNVKHKKVMNVYGIADRSYLKSGYKGVTDEAVIQKYVSNIDNYYVDPAAANDASGAKIEKAKVVLGTPVVGYSTYYRYAENKNEELLIPSLIFPVDHVEGGKDVYYYRTTIVVPLAQEMLDEQSGGGYPTPYMMKGGMEGDVAPPVEATAPSAVR